MAKYEYTKAANRPFVNPYNFVTTNFAKTDRTDVNTTKEGVLHTGVLNCKIITKTPLAIPDNDYTEDDKKHKKYPFFNYGDGKPMIPGSTLRGVIRNVYETASDSCFSTAREDAIITTRSSKAFKPGVLMKNEAGKWELYKAERYIFVVDGQGYKQFSDAGKEYKIVEKDDLKKYKFGAPVSFNASEEGYNKKNRDGKNKFLVGKYVSDFSTDENSRLPLKGYLYIGELFSRKHFESIFYLGKEPVMVAEFEPNDKSILGLEETREIYNDPKINRNLKDKFYGGYENAKEKGAIPLWYNEEADGSIYLTLACLGRMAYQNTMGDVLGEKKPCTKRNKVCKACALFGMASSEEAIGGRVRITDAHVSEENGDWYMGYQTLKELAGPKISYLPFYVNASGNKWSYDEASTSIRGRKFYWHTDNKNSYPTNERTERNSTMQLVKPKVEFEFKVYFNDITETQLKELEWALTFGENKADGSLCHKVGHGKPIGLGSAKIVIESRMERTTDDGYVVTENVPSEKAEPVFKGTAVEELLIIADMNTTKGKTVRYPYIEKSVNMNFKSNDNNIAPHKWFSQNYRLGANRTEQQWVTIKDVKIGKRTLCAYDIHEAPGRF